MNRTLFIGDSHTCGYISLPGKQGPGTYSYWNDNSYCDIYSEENKKPGIVYAMAGVNNRVYTDWLKSMFEKYEKIDEVYICLSALNRFTVAYDPGLVDEVIPVDNFTAFDTASSTDNMHHYADLTGANDRIQLFNKPIYSDYQQPAAFEITPEKGLVEPDLRKNTFMEVKLWFDMNTYIEKRNFLNDIYTWDNICNDHGAKLYLFNFTERLKYPNNFEYYGKLKCTTVATKTVQGFFANRMIDHSKYLLPDNEHYDKTYHHMVATQYIPWLKSL